MSAGWKRGTREFSSVTPPRTRKPLKRSPSFEAKVPAISRRDRSIIPAVPKFTEPLKSVTAGEGGSVKFLCKITGNPAPKVTWSRNQNVLEVPTDRMTLEVNEYEYTLSISPVKREDAGRFTCVASNNLGKVNSVALLNVQTSSGFKTAGKVFGMPGVKPLTPKPDAKNTKSGSVTGLSNRGERAGFNSCGESIRSSDSGFSRPSSRETCSSSSSYSYPPSVFGDSTSASSQALFSPDSALGTIGPSSDRAPHFTSKPRSQVVEEADSVTFECKADGTPNPSVNWFKGFVKLQSSDRVDISEKRGIYSLRIDGLKANDAGSYKCVAMNRTGKSTVNFELRLAARASTNSARDSPPTFSQPLTDVEVNEGGRARFECKADGRPKPTVVWEKDGKEIAASSRVRIMEMYGTHSLVLSRTDHADTGRYSVTATNHVGSESCSAQLRVKESSYSSSSSTPRGRRSEVGTPTYSSSGSPATSAVSSPSMSPKLNKAANSKLVSGSVSSWATEAKSRSNSGSGSSPRRRAPGFILRPRPQTVQAGEKLVLKCSLLGHPKPTVSWEKDGVKYDEGTDDRVVIREDGTDHFLEIEECAVEDAGKYTIQAKNSLGRQSAIVDVVILGDGRNKGTQKTTNARSNDINDKLNNNMSTKSPQRLEITVTRKSVGPGSLSSASSRSISSNEDSSSYRSRRPNQVAPTFTRRLSSTQVLEGDTLELECEITGTPMPELSWTRNGVPISSRDSNTDVEMKNGVATLKVSRVRPSHAGEYLCLAKNSAGDSKCSSRVTVKTKQRQSKPRFIRPPKDVRIEEGEVLSLEAEVSGMPSPEVLWSLDGEEISNGESSYKNNVAKLVLHNVSIASSGQYMCTAINDAGSDSAACRVRIKQKRMDTPPEFTAPLSDVKTKEGKDIRLRCTVAGIPEPRVQWYLNEETLEQGDGLEMTFRDGDATLTLEQVTPEDTGTYSCTAVNSEGKVTTSCQVVVSELPEKAPPIVERAPEFVSKFEDYTRAVEGDSVTFECQVRGSPEPEITWTIDRKALKGAQQSFEKGRAILTINSIMSDHGGNLVCTAKNSSGQAKHEGRVYVRTKREPPTFIAELPPSVEVAEGDVVTFGCQVKGHPQPRVTWTRNGRSLSVLNSETSYEDGKASVRIRKAGNSDGGKYVCTARNLSGESETSCIVTVCSKQAAPKPSFSRSLEDMSIEVGQDIRLECEVAKASNIDISWKLDGQKLEDEDGESTFKDGVARMVLEDAMKEDSGVYECIARNKGGEASTSCKVSVMPKKPVEEQPSFPIQLEDMTVNQDQDIVLKCQVKGNPRPTITWLIDGDPLDADFKYADDGTVEVHLAGAMPDDEGVYTCIAQNMLKRVMCSCKVTVKAKPKPSKASRAPQDTKVYEVKKPAVPVVKSTPDKSASRVNGKTHPIKAPSSEDEAPEQEGPDKPPTFLADLEDRVVPDGSRNYKLTARVGGVPPPVVKWYLDDEEIEESDDFKFETDAETRTLIFAEVFPDDSGVYTCVARNTAGEARAEMKMTVEEIDGDPPTFITKPRPLTTDAGQNAILTCKVDGEPEPTVKWLYCNRPIQSSERVIITNANARNQHVHSLEILETRIEDAGRYAACCSNLLGDITCTVSLIVNAPKNQEEQRDFRTVLKPSASHKAKSPEPSQPQQLDFRKVLKKSDGPLSPDAGPAKKEGDQPDYREVLSSRVKTKVLSEEERKMLRAEQKDFRSNLVRKVDTKAVTTDTLKLKQPEQKDFRDEAIKTKVKTKAYQEEVIKMKQPEQKDFRAEALKTKVVTKAFKEESMKHKRPEQVDFREVLSPTRRHSSKDEDPAPTDTSKIERPAAPAKMKINKDKMEHNTVATRRARQRGSEATVRKAKSIEVEERKGRAPEFSKNLQDVKVKDSEPFVLECHVTGEPAAKISWFLDDEEINAETDITITREGDICKLHVPESFPDDEGTYVCVAENEHGVIKCSAHVTVILDDSKPAGAPPPFLKKQSSGVEKIVTPASVLNGPDDVTIMRGNPISLCCALSGTPPLKSMWRKGKNEITTSSQCCLDVTDTSAALTIRKSERDDSGCYILQVKNSAGVDQYSINVSVVDVPDSPGQPYASDIAGSTLVVSWYGTGYDGGSTITGYRVEMANVTSTSRSPKWSQVATAQSTSCMIKDLKPNSKYIFRVRAENKYGMGAAGQQSDVVLNTVTKVDESSEDEETFVKRDAVTIKTDGSFSQRYETKERLGQGRFGKVHRVVDRETRKEYAAKIMRALKAKDKEAVQQEIDIMNSLRHPCLVQLIDAYSHGREITMVMDLVSGGELFERVIDEDFELTEAACIKYMSQICDGLKYMHDTLILHLDLKPENIMCINKTGTQIKIIDFGLARRYNPRETIRVMFGTPEFVAPEVINYDAIGPQTDMWSVGVICYILLSGLSPFMGDNDAETLSNITAVEWDFDDEAFDEISHEAKDFIRQLLVKNLNKRYTVHKALEHKWLKKDTNKMAKSKLNTKNLKRFLARRKWQKTGNAVRALGRLASLANLGSSSSNPKKISNGQPRESGFLAALKAQLLRENEEEQDGPTNCKPIFETLFDDVEVIEGSAARFECTIIGTPDPEVMWFKDGEPVKESRHFRISYTEDDVCTLLVSDATEADEAEYTCKAVNCEGETEHRAELIVITPGV